jgi:hypothetical protein
VFRRRVDTAALDEKTGRIPMSVKHVYVVAIAALIGCSSGNRESSVDPAIRPRNSNFLSSTEIITAHADLGTAYDAIARLRPNWLASHGVSTFEGRDSELAVVYVDGQQYGGLSHLRNIAAYQIADSRYYDVTEAGARFGIKAGSGGVIEIRLK